MTWWTAVQAALALLLVVVGVTMAVAGGLLLGGVLTTCGGLWLWRCDRAL
jgi:hypothetical protein